MDIGLRKQPTRFYGRTLVFWAGILFLGPLSIVFYVAGTLLLLGIETDPNGQPDPEAGIALMVSALLLTFLVFACVFQVYARQYPVLKIFQEGIETRSIGVPIPSNIVMVNLFALGLWIFILPLIALYQVITLQAFRIQTFRLRWEHVDTIPMATGAFTINGWGKKNHNDFEHDPAEYCSIPFGTDSFGTPINKVMGAVQFFLHNPDSRGKLPSWQDEETLYGNDTFDF